MADPKIRYDILANAEGEQDVRRLAAELEKLDDAIDPKAAERAKALAAEIRELGQQQAAVQTFTEIKRQSEAARAALDEAQAAAQKFGKEIAASEAPTRAQAGQLEKLRDAVRAAKEEVQQQTLALDGARGTLSELGVSTTNLASTEVALRNSLQATKSEIQALGQQSQAIQAFRDLVSATESARDRFTQADAALETYRRSLGATQEPTLAQTRQLTLLNEQAKASQLAFQTASQAQAQSATALRASGVDTERLVALQQQLSPQLTRIAAAARQTATGYGQLGSEAAAAGRQQVTANTEAASTLDLLKGQLNAVRNIAGLALGGSLVGSLAKDLADTADSYNNLAARIKIATGEGASFDATFKGVFQTAQRTGVAVEEVGTLTTKLIQAGKEIKLSSADALALAESVAQATQLSGASAQEAASAVTQFAQAIASGRLQGDELKSLLETSPRLAKALADGLGVTIGQLRELGTAGSLTSQQVIAALQGQSAALQAEFQTLPLTVGRAVTNLSSAWTQYIGQADQASGASHTAAEAIGLLARNLDVVAGFLFGAGKAAAAYTALRLAESFLATATAARATAAATVLATEATAAHTVAVVANTGAQAANAAASAESAAGAGRLAGALGLLKTISFLGVVTNLREIGTAIGEGVAKWAGYGKAIEDAERAAKADEEATRANTQAKAAFQQKLRQAADAALGLTKESRALVAEFDGLIEKGDGVAEALGKVSKNLQFDNVKGITNAVTALDALQQRGKITATQLTETLGAALKGLDLGVFEAQARAAFDTSEQGARRLKAALDAIADEGLRRAGSSLQELQTGFSKAANSALNDLDAVSKSLGDLGIKGDDAGRVLSKAVDQALAAAGTERAVRAVIDRVVELGKQGQLTGDFLTEALQKAKDKADDLKTGVNSLDEALRAFGLKTKAELTTTADKLGQAYEKISGSANVSLENQIEAFVKWRDAAVAAGKKVEGGQLAVAQASLQIRANAAGMGAALESALNKASDSAKRTKADLDAVGQSAIDITDPALAARNAKIASGKAAGSLGANIQATKSGGITRTEGGPQAVPPDNSGEWIATNDPRLIQTYAVDSLGRGIPGVGWYRATKLQGMPAAAPSPAPAPASASAAASEGGFTMNVTIGGKPFGLAANSRSDLDRMIEALEAAYRAGGG